MTQTTRSVTVVLKQLSANNALRSALRGCITMLAALALLAGGVGQVRAEVIITFSQQGLNVVATSNGGTFNLTALTSQGSDTLNAQVWANSGLLNLGTVPGIVDTNGYVGITGPTTFGLGGQTLPTSGSGGPVGVTHTPALSFNGILVPQGYSSGTPIPLATDTWANTTISGLGLTPGTYEWTWGSAAAGNADDLKIVIPASVPEPASLALLGFGIVGFAGYRWRKRRALA
jgi:hypothetical protein